MGEVKNGFRHLFFAKLYIKKTSRKDICINKIGLGKKSQKENTNASNRTIIIYVMGSLDPILSQSQP